MKYKIGDKVRIRRDLQTGIRYHMSDGSTSNDATTIMTNMAGKFAVIIGLSPSGKQYRINNSSLSWTDEMFEGIKTELIVIFDKEEHRGEE